MSLSLVGGVVLIVSDLITLFDMKAWSYQGEVKVVGRVVFFGVERYTVKEGPEDKDPVLCWKGKRRFVHFLNTCFTLHFKNGYFLLNYFSLISVKKK